MSPETEKFKLPKGIKPQSSPGANEVGTSYACPSLALSDEQKRQLEAARTKGKCCTDNFLRTVTNTPDQVAEYTKRFLGLQPNDYEKSGLANKIKAIANRIGTTDFLYNGSDVRASTVFADMVTPERALKETLIGAPFFDQLPGNQANTLIHESVHAALSLGGLDENGYEFYLSSDRQRIHRSASGPGPHGTQHKDELLESDVPKRFCPAVTNLVSTQDSYPSQVSQGFEGGYSQLALGWESIGKVLLSLTNAIERWPLEDFPANRRQSLPDVWAGMIMEFCEKERLCGQEKGEVT